MELAVRNPESPGREAVRLSFTDCGEAVQGREPDLDGISVVAAQLPAPAVSK